MPAWWYKPVTKLKQQIKALKVSFWGKLLYTFIPYRQKLVDTNIEQVFGAQLTKDEKIQLKKAFYSHLATSIKEGLMLRFISEDNLKNRVEVRGQEHPLAVVAQNKGVLILTGHLGNWEFAPIGGILNFKEFQGKMYFIRRTLGFKFLERLLFKRYYASGLHVIPKKNSLQQVCDALDKGHGVIFVLDQHACLENRDGIAAEFFGKKAGTYRSLASLARNTGIPVIPATSYRLPNGRHVLEFKEPLYWKEYDNLQESLYQNTLAYNQALEKLILAHPEQWMWFHKRWKLD